MSNRTIPPEEIGSLTVTYLAMAAESDRLNTEIARLAAENAALKAEIAEWNRCAAYQGFAGSEYFGDPKRVFQRVREIQDARMNAAKELIALRAKLEVAERDTARLDWLCKQGPPGAAPGSALNEDLWDSACGMIRDEDDHPLDTMLVRRAIDAAMNAPEGK